jgi:hypothetical protein
MRTANKLRWYVHRLRAMNWTEVCHRMAERCLHATEADFLQKIASIADSLVTNREDVPRLPDPTTAPLNLRSQLTEDSRRLQRGEWELFGWKLVEVGAPPCWHRDAASGVVIDPRTKSHRLNHRNLAHGADARTVWEINRWAEMTRLAMHGWLNGDLGAIRTAQLWLEDWCDRNAPGLGINWTSPLEAALRLINFCWFDALVRAAVGHPAANSHDLVKAQDTLVDRIVPVHAALIWRYRSAGSSANNHLLGELAALTVAVSRWPGLAKVSCTAEAAWESLGAEVLRQFAEDGGSREQALHYHLFALDMAWQAVRAMGCRGGEVYDRLTLAGLFFSDMVHPVQPWDFGDSDDAQVVPCTLRRSRSAAEWSAWLQGENGTLRFWLGESPLRSVTAKPAIAAVDWRMYRQSGIAVCDAQTWKLRLDASPLGFGDLAAHGHNDALHLSIWDDGEALIIDPGTGGYFAAKELREELAGWGAHNGPQSATGFRYPQRIGTFLQVRHHAVPALLVDESAASAVFVHEGHAFQRHVEVQDGEIEINDSEGQQRPFHVAWHFGPQCTVSPVRADDFSRLRITSGARHWEMTIQGQVRMALGEARVSSAYGRTEMAMLLSIAAASPLCTKLKRVM